MQRRAILRIVKIYAMITALLTVIWNITLSSYILPNYFVETEVVVTEISRVRPTTTRGGQQINYFPTYEYLDDNGQTKIYESKDGYNWINSFLFEKKVGDKLQGYYEKGSQNGIWITGTGDWLTFRAAPLVFAIFPGALIIGVIILLKSRKIAKPDLQ